MTVSMRSLGVLLLATSLGCGSPATMEPDTICFGGKCDDDSSTPSELVAIPLDDLVMCRGVADPSTTDPFFAVHELRCRLGAVEGIDVERVYFELRDGDGGFVANTDPIEGADRTERVSARLQDDDFPVQLQITVDFSVTGETSSHYWGFETVLANRAALVALTEEAPLTVDVPLEVWPVVLWPAEALVAAWDEGSESVLVLDYAYSFPVAGSADLAVAGPSPLTMVNARYSRTVSASEVPALALLARARLYLLAPRTPLTPAPRLGVQARSGSVDSALEGPGYYVIGLDGVATRTAPEDLPALFLPAPTPSADAGTSADGGPSPAPIDAGPPPDPCAGACAPTQVCVAGECRHRGDQTQAISFGTTCHPPERSCDAGEDADCAPDHGCVAGFCRRLACQDQDLSFGTTCHEADQACEQDAHCATGHSCVSGLCRRTACQDQNLSFGTTCEAADQPCARDLDCTDAHTCVEGLCRRTACQDQNLSFGTTCEAADQPCGRDADCTSGHACVAGDCRRLVCQDQDLQFGTTCAAADQPCETDAHCAADHVCGDGECLRVVCN